MAGDLATASGHELPRLLIVTRFGVGVTDRPWLEHRLDLVRAVTGASLASQTSQHFCWAILVDDGLPQHVRDGLQAVVGALEDAHLVDAARYQYTTKGFQALARDLGTTDPRGRMLTARLDDDDAWNVEVVRWLYAELAVWQEQAEPTAPGVGLTFDTVVEWVMYRMLNVPQLHRGRFRMVEPHAQEVEEEFASMSVFVLSDARADVSARSAGHQLMPEFLAERGYDVRVIRPGQAASLYCRHKQANTALTKGHRDVVPRAADIAELSAQFGLDAALVRAYVDGAESIPYLLEARPNHRRRERAAQQREIEAELADEPTPDQQARLRARRRLLDAEEARINSSKVAAFPELLQLRGGRDAASEEERIGELRGVLAERARAQTELEDLLTLAERDAVAQREAVDELTAKVRQLRRRLKQSQSRPLDE